MSMDNTRTKARITAIHQGRIIAQHDYTSTTEQERCRETIEFVAKWTGNECDSNNADMFQHHDLSGNTRNNWTLEV